MVLRSYIDLAEIPAARRELPRLKVKPARRPTIEPRDMSDHVSILHKFERLISCLSRRSGL